MLTFPKMENSIILVVTNNKSLIKFEQNYPWPRLDLIKLGRWNFFLITILDYHWGYGNWKIKILKGLCYGINCNRCENLMTPGIPIKTLK